MGTRCKALCKQCSPPPPPPPPPLPPPRSAPPPPPRRDDSDDFDMVVCQADKQVVCDPSAVANATGVIDALDAKHSATEEPLKPTEELLKPTCNNTTAVHLNSRCTSNKEIKAVARCVFNVDVWNLGGTCIANHVHNSTVKNCPHTADRLVIGKIYQLCSKATSNDHRYCTRIGMSY